MKKVTLKRALFLNRNSIEEDIVGGVKPNCFARIDPSGQVLVSRRMKIASLIWGDEFKPPMTFNLPMASCK